MRSSTATSRVEVSRTPTSAGQSSAEQGKGLRLCERRWWPQVKRWLSVIFFVLVAALLATQAQTIEWDKVLESTRKLPQRVLLLAALTAAASQLLYSCFDLLGRHLSGHTLPTRSVMAITFVSYAFNLNLGAAIGAFAFRYRLYSKYGLRNGVIARVLGFSMFTNWLGYFFVAGLLFMAWPLQLPPDWKIDGNGLRFLGAVMLALALAYVICSARWPSRTLDLRGHVIELPSARMAMLQLGMASVNWLLIGITIWLLLRQRIDFPAVLAVFLIAAVAGVLTHIPAGLGVLEAVFVALLSHEISSNELLGALLAYRAIYYLIPLASATLMYVLMESRIKRRKTE